MEWPKVITTFEFEGKQYTLVAEKEDDEYSNDRFHAVPHDTLDYKFLMNRKEKQESNG